MDVGSEAGKVVVPSKLRLGWRKEKAHTSSMEGEEEEASIRGNRYSAVASFLGYVTKADEHYSLFAAYLGKGTTLSSKV